jgi:hypothetical protein
MSAFQEGACTTEFVIEEPDKTRLKLFKIIDCKTGYL